MTTLVEVLKQNEQKDKEKRDIANKLASFLETEKIIKVMTEAIEASTGSGDVEACVQVDNNYIFLRVINSRVISFTVKEITEGNTPFIELLDARFKFVGSNKIGGTDKPRLIEFALSDIFVEIFNYNSRLSSDKVLYYLEKVMGIEEQ